MTTGQARALELANSARDVFGPAESGVSVDHGGNLHGLRNISGQLRDLG